MQIGLGDLSTHVINQAEDAVKNAGIQYANDNNGLLPTDPSQLLPYLKPGISPSQVQQVLSQIPPGVTTMAQLQKLMR
jgi:hypothetical protein